MSIPATTGRPRGVLARTLLFGAGTLFAAAALLAGTPASTTGWNQAGAEGTLWQLLNGARVNNGMAPLQQHGTLVGIARWRSSDMLNRDYFSHTIPGCNCLVYVSYDQNGLQYRWAGENISWNSGQTDSYSPVHAHNRFMGSPGHRKNVLDPSFTHGGVGAAAANDRMYQGYVQDTRMYTELFMQAAAAPAPPSQPAPPPPSGGGGGGAAAPRAAPATPSAPAPTPAAEPDPTPKEMSVADPQRPVSSVGVDGVATVVVRSVLPDPVTRLAADDALGVDEPTTPAKQPGVLVARRGLEVQAAGSSEAGAFEGILDGLLGLLLG